MYGTRSHGVIKHSSMDVEELRIRPGSEGGLVLSKHVRHVGLRPVGIYPRSLVQQVEDSIGGVEHDVVRLALSVVKDRASGVDVSTGTIVDTSSEYHISLPVL